MKEHELFDQREFKEALKLFVAHTSKDFIEATNGVARDACFKYTGEQDSMKQSELTPFSPLRKKGDYKNRLFYALAAKKGFRKGSGIKEEARRKYKKRKKSSGYLKMMMLRAAQDLGAPVRSKMPSAGSAADKTHATRAAQFRAYADIATGFTDQGAVDKIEPAFKSALIKAARVMRGIAEKRMAKTAAKYSGR